MRYLMLPLLLIVLAFGLWPYYHLYRLDRALVQNDVATLTALLDLDAIRTEYMRHPPQITGAPRNTVTQAFHQIASVLSGNTDHPINLDWVREALRPIPARPDESYPSILHYVTCAFFEKFNQFAARIRDLGEKPIHVRWTLHDWMWRVTAIYDGNEVVSTNK